jgi:zinc protease
MYFDTNAKMAARLADMALYDLPTDYFDTYPAKVNALSTQQIKEVWQRRLKAADMNIVVVGQ